MSTKPRFRISVVIEEQDASGEWVSKIGRPITIVEDNGSEPTARPEQMLEDIATALEIKLGEIEAETKA